MELCLEKRYGKIFNDKFVKNRKAILIQALFILYQNTGYLIDSYLVDNILKYLQKILFRASYALGKQNSINDVRIKYGNDRIIKIKLSGILDCNYLWVNNYNYGWIIFMKSSVVWTIIQFIKTLKENLNNGIKMEMKINNNIWDITKNIKFIIQNNQSNYFITNPPIINLKGEMYGLDLVINNIETIDTNNIRGCLFLWEDLQTKIIEDNNLIEITKYIQKNTHELYRLS